MTPNGKNPGRVFRLTNLMEIIELHMCLKKINEKTSGG